jgi:hypothetical protein
MDLLIRRFELTRRAIDEAAAASAHDVNQLDYGLPTPVETATYMASIRAADKRWRAAQQSLSDLLALAREYSPRVVEKWVRAHLRICAAPRFAHLAAQWEEVRAGTRDHVAIDRTLEEDYLQRTMEELGF